MMMKEWFDNRFPKKFHVRIKLNKQGSGNYKIQYCYYRFFKIWFTIKKWWENDWCPVLLNAEYAEQKALTFKTYEDVHVYNINELIKECETIQSKLKRLEEKEQRRNKNNPFKIKEIL